jgi:hypothetical protein
MAPTRPRYLPLHPGQLGKSFVPTAGSMLLVGTCSLSRRTFGALVQVKLEVRDRLNSKSGHYGAFLMAAATLIIVISFSRLSP